MENLDFGQVSTSTILLWALTGLLAIVIPVIVAIVWCKKKKEPFTSVLIGAAAFMLFAIVIEKAIQNVLIFPTQLGLPEHAASAFINARPILWSLLVGLFPGVFEETGRLIAFKTLLRKRTQRETSISYGIGHGMFEVMFLIGLTAVSNIMIAFMVNSGAIMQEVEEVLKEAPDMMQQVTDQINGVASYGIAAFVVTVIERIFAVLFHIGASILVFYACKKKKNWWLYPLAIIIHTLIDGFAALMMAGVITIPDWLFEVGFAAAGAAVFFGGYLFLYRKDTDNKAVSTAES